MTTETPEPRKPEPRAARRSLVLLWTSVALLALYSLWAVEKGRSGLSDQRATLSELSGRLDVLANENATLRSQLVDAVAQLDEAGRRLGAVDKETDSVRTLALGNRSRALRETELLNGALDEQRTQVATLSRGMDVVGTEVGANRKELDRAFGSIGQQGMEIARNRHQLAALERMAGRDYFEFDIRRSKDFSRVGPMSLRLGKTDHEHQRYTVTVVVDDKRVEKKDNTLLEPVQFYLPGTRSVLELVVREIHNGRIVGYVSSPKQPQARLLSRRDDSAAADDAALR